jgi:hypothetical protein
MTLLKQLGHDNPIVVQNELGVIELVYSASLEIIQSASADGLRQDEQTKPMPIKTAEEALSALKVLIMALAKLDFEYARGLAVSADSGLD